MIRVSSFALLLMFSTITVSADTLIGNNTTEGIGAVSGGDMQTVYGSASGAYGTGSTVFGAFAQTLPDLFNTPDYGVNTFSMFNGSAAFGFYSNTVGAMNVAVGGQAQAGADLDYIDANGMRVMSGGAATAVGYSSLADNSEASAFGFYSMAHGENSTSLGAHAIASANFSVALGAWSVSRDPWTVSVGDEMTGIYRRVTNVANPIYGHDAVNKNYADALLTTAKAYTDTAITGLAPAAPDLTLAYDYTDTQIADATGQAVAEAKGYTDSKAEATLGAAQTYTDTKSAETLTSANSYTDTQIAALEKNLKIGIASAAATSIALSQTLSFADGAKFAMGIGTGFYENQSAGAVNMAYRVKNAVFNGGGAFGSTRAFKAGVSMSW